MTQRPLSIPPWAPVAAAAAFVVWAASIWWMVATLPTGGDTTSIEDNLSLVADRLESANAEIAALSEQVRTLEDERASLVARVEELEAKPLSAAFEMSADAPTEGDAETEAEQSEFFTDGADRYNCRDFASKDEAQEALDVNGPGDPNHIDSNNNGLACEDFTYRAPSTASVAPTATPTPTPTPAR